MTYGGEKRISEAARGADATAPAGAAFFAACAAASAVLLVRIALLPPERQVLWTPDDAFYYFIIAHNRARMSAWTFDGENPTTGFQPAYAWILAAAAEAFGLSLEGVALAGAVISIAALLLSGIVVKKVASFFVSNHHAWLIGGLWLVTPYNFRTTATRMESALVLAAGPAVLWCWLALRREAETRQAAFVVAASALAVLCRADMLFLAGSLAFCGLMFPAGCSAPGGRRGLALHAQLLAPVAGAALGLAASAVFCWSVTGKPSPDSGRMKMFWASYAHGAGWQMLKVKWERFAWQITSMALSPFGTPEFSPRADIALRQAAAAALLIGGCVFILLSVRRRSSVGLRRVLAVAAVAHAFAYAAFLAWFVEHVQETWYYSTIQAGVMSLYLIAAGGTLGSTVLAKRPAAAAALAAALCLAIAVRPDERYAVAAQGVKVARSLDRIIPPGATIGAWNAGILSFYSGRRIINLDGVVNASIEPYARRRALGRYILDNRIEWIVDMAGQPFTPLQRPLFEEGWMERHASGGRIILTDPDGRRLETAIAAWRIVP